MTKPTERPFAYIMVLIGAIFIVPVVSVVDFGVGVIKKPISSGLPTILAWNVARLLVSRGFHFTNVVSWSARIELINAVYAVYQDLAI